MAVVSLAVVLAIGACKKPEVAAPPPPVVEVMEITTSDVPLTASLIGQLDSPQNVEVRARVEAFVDKMLFTEGMGVKAGDTLFELDRKPLIEKLNAANGALGEAEAALGKYQADVARLKPLAERRAIPQQDLDNAVAAVDVGEANVVTAKSRVESAQIDLGYCEVKAPISGLIGAKQVSIGDLVGKGEPTLLATISTLDPIWFYGNISEKDYLETEEKIQNAGLDIYKLPLTLVLTGGKEFDGKGNFVFLDRAVDARTGTIRVRAQFSNPTKVLRPGMFARVKAEMGTRKQCIEVPERAIVEIQGRNFVWVVGKDGRSTQRPVVLGDLVNFNYIVTSGLAVGERVVVEGLQKVREGALVNAMTAAQIAAAKSAPAAGTQPAKE